LAGDLFQDLTFDRRQGVARLGASILASMLVFQAIDIEAAADSSVIVHGFPYTALP